MEVPGKRTDTDDEAESIASLDKLCQPCKVGNDNTPANGFCKECEEFMCTACFRQHLRLNLCRHHALLDINSSSETCLKRHSRATKCKQHDGETVKFYCRKHEAVGCGDCVVSNHNKCESEFITNFSENFQQHEDYKTFIKQLEQLISERKEFEKKVKENKKDNKVMLEKALEDIKQFRFDINKYLDKVETDITCQVKNVMEENETLLNELENDCSMLSTKLEELTNMLNSELYKDNVLFIHTIECKPKFSESEKKMSTMKSKSMKQYEFVCDQQLRSLVTSVQKLGTLAVKSSAVFVQTIEGVSEKGVRSDVRVGARVKYNSDDTHRDISTIYIGQGTDGKYKTWGERRETGTVTDVHDDGCVTVEWDHNGKSHRYRIGVGSGEVTLIKK